MIIKEQDIKEFAEQCNYDRTKTVKHIAKKWGYSWAAAGKYFTKNFVLKYSEITESRE